MMNSAPSTVSSRLEEEGRIAARWISRIGECLGSGGSRDFTEALREAGITRARVEESSGLQLHHVDDVIRTLRPSHPDIRLRLMKVLRVTDIGVVGFAAMSSDRIDKAFEVALTYHVLTSARFDLEMRIEGKTAVIQALPKAEFLGENVDIAEDGLAGSWRLFELFLGRESRHEFGRASLHFEFPEPSYAEAYAATLTCPFFFDAERTELRVPAEWLSRRVATANPAVAEVCRAMCDRIMGPRGASTDTPEDVARLLLSRTGRRILPLEEAAERMHMSPSQLRKRLYRAGTSYKRIVVETRMALAKHYLETSRLSIQNIAYLLDYSEAAAFTRAFKREFGVSPQEYRDDALRQRPEPPETTDPQRFGRWFVQ
jgi:AraC-like DNA-binding protein